MVYWIGTYFQKTVSLWPYPIVWFGPVCHHDDVDEPDFIMCEKIDPWLKNQEEEEDGHFLIIKS